MLFTKLMSRSNSVDFSPGEDPVLFASHTNQLYSSRQCWKMVVGSDTRIVYYAVACALQHGCAEINGTWSDFKSELVMKIQSFRQHNLHGGYHSEFWNSSTGCCIA